MASEDSPLISKNNDSLSTVGRGSTTSSAGNASMGRGQKLFVTLCILLTEFCERLTFHGISANLLLFSSIELNLPSPWPSTISYLFIGTCALIPLLGGWLADTYMGRFNTIFAFSLLYLVGTVLLAVVSITDDMFIHTFNSNFIHDKKMRVVYFALSLVMIAVGTGGIKANVWPFGADQVQSEGPRAVQTFFNWFYWFITVGSLISFTVIVYVQQSNVFYGYCITAGTMFLAVVVFLVPRNKYLTNPPGGSQLSETAKIIREAIRNRKQNAGAWLDGAKSRYGGKFSEEQVENVETVLRVIGVFIFFIAYWTIYSQFRTTVLLQATYMKLEFENFTIPAASLTIVVIVAVLMLIPIMDHVVYPILTHYGLSFTPLRRIGVGMLLAAASMVVAGVVEIERRNTWQDGGFIVQKIFNEDRNASSLSIFWQAPQCFLIGSSEVLAAITGIEFAYSQAPKCFQGVVMGAFLVTGSLGNYLANLIVVIVRSASSKDWYPEKDLNKGHVEYFFFLLAGLMFLNSAVFLYVASSYKYKPLPKRTEEIIEDWDDTCTGQRADCDLTV